MKVSWDDYPQYMESHKIHVPNQLYIYIFTHESGYHIPINHPSFFLLYKIVTWQCVKTLVPLVNIKIAGKWMFIPLKMALIGIDPYPYG